MIFSKNFRERKEGVELKSLSGLHKRFLLAHTRDGVVRRAYWVKSEDIAQGSHPTAPVTRASVGFSLLHRDTNRQISNALEAIGKVHTVPNTIYKLPITLEHSIQDGSSHGEYRVGGTALLHPKSRILIEKGSHNAAFHLCHEYGHYLDHHLFGTGAFSARAIGTFRGGRDVVPLMRAILRSRSAKRVLEQHHNNTNSKDRAKLNVTTYLLRPPELFARAYSQWIVLRSGSAELRKQFVEHETAWRDYGYMAHWDRKDFIPIAREFDRLFKRRGLLR